MQHMSDDVYVANLTACERVSIGFSMSKRVSIGFNTSKRHVRKHPVINISTDTFKIYLFGTDTVKSILGMRYIDRDVQRVNKMFNIRFRFLVHKISIRHTGHE